MCKCGLWRAGVGGDGCGGTGKGDQWCEWECDGALSCGGGEFAGGGFYDWE